MKKILRIIATFPEGRQVAAYLTLCRLVIAMMTNNTRLLNPTVALSLVEAHLDKLETDQELAGKGSMGAAEQRDVSLGVVHNDMRMLKAFVQSVADSNINEAEAIIRSAGMGVAKRRVRNKQAVAAKQGKAPGGVVLHAKALPPPVQYRWQMSTDQKSWTDLPETFFASTTVEGLTAATVYYFRLRTVTPDGTSEWSVVVNIIVH
jgi:hypothetical protein